MNKQSTLTSSTENLGCLDLDEALLGKELNEKGANPVQKLDCVSIKRLIALITYPLLIVNIDWLIFARRSSVRLFNLVDNPTRGLASSPS